MADQNNSIDQDDFASKVDSVVCQICRINFSDATFPTIGECPKSLTKLHAWSPSSSRCKYCGADFADFQTVECAKLMYSDERYQHTHGLIR